MDEEVVNGESSGEELRRYFGFDVFSSYKSGGVDGGAARIVPWICESRVCGI